MESLTNCSSVKAADTCTSVNSPLVNLVPHSPCKQHPNRVCKSHIQSSLLIETAPFKALAPLGGLIQDPDGEPSFKPRPLYWDPDERGATPSTIRKGRVNSLQIAIPCKQILREWPPYPMNAPPVQCTVRGRGVREEWLDTACCETLCHDILGEGCQMQTSILSQSKRDPHTSIGESAPSV